MSSHSMISVSHLTKKFGDFTAVNDISFEVTAGEIFAFLGPNGAGKSTTIKVITTLMHLTDGVVKLNQNDVTINQAAARRTFGIVFQDPSLDEELTAEENMDLHGGLYGVPQPLRRRRIEELLNLVELWDRRHDFVKTFSGGMRRRLEIARGLLHHPQIFFLDEPTLGLDPQTRNQVWAYIQKLNETEKITVFFTTHYLEEAEKMAQRIAIIDHGQIIAQGTTAELKRQTNTQTLEEAFLQLTGKQIREETLDANASAQYRLRMRHRH